MSHLIEILQRNPSDCIEVVRELSSNHSIDASLIRRTRKMFGDAAAHLINIAGLQSRAVKKLGPGTWFVTEKSLQQSTECHVARWKARLFNSLRVVDLCCGIGGDSIALAQRAPLKCVDRDPLIVEYARVNLAQIESRHCVDVVCADVLDVPIATSDAIHIDPDRRSGDSRSTDPIWHEPSWEQVLRLIGHCDAAMVKLAPGARIEEPAIPFHRCWISFQGSVREQSLITGGLIDSLLTDENSRANSDQIRSSIHIDSGGHANLFSAQPTRAITLESRPKRWIVDPDPAIRAAGLTEGFCHRHGMSAIGRASGFLTCDDVTPLSRAMAICQEVVWSGSADDRKLRRELRSRNLYPQTVKVRGSGHDPIALTKRYRKCGETPTTLWIGRSHDRVYAAIGIAAT